MLPFTSAGAALRQGVGRWPSQADQAGSTAVRAKTTVRRYPWQGVERETAALDQHLLRSR